MRILGIDPGYAIVGYGVVDYSGGSFSVVSFGAITTGADMPFNKRLKTIYDDMCEIIDTYSPDEMGIEKLFFNSNEKTAIDVAQARGVTILPAIQRNIPIYEYTPLQVKCSIVGYGRAEKKTGTGNDQNNASSQRGSQARRHRRRGSYCHYPRTVGQQQKDYRKYEVLIND